MLKYLFALTGVIKAGILILFVLILSTIIILILKRTKPKNDWRELTLRIKSWWIMALFFFGAIVINRKLSLLVFCFLSFWALKEYFTILDTRRSDHRALFWAFLSIPIQYYWALIGWYGMFIIFIPVYMFLFLPIRLVLAKDTSGFLSSSAKIQWGLMAFVFCLSHLGYLLILPETTPKLITGQSFLLFLVISTEMNDVLQYLWGKGLGRKKILPTISPKKTWEGFLGGVITTPLLSLGLRFLVPFSVLQTICIAIIISVAGFCGDVVMSAVKRDAGIKDFGNIIPGHGGMLDRVDSLCFTAPIFFHIVHYLYY